MSKIYLKKKEGRFFFLTGSSWGSQPEGIGGDMTPGPEAEYLVSNLLFMFLSSICGSPFLVRIFRGVSLAPDTAARAPEMCNNNILFLSISLYF